MEGLAPLLCIRADSDGVPNLNHSPQGYWLILFGPHTDHSLILALSISLSFTLSPPETEWVHRIGKRWQIKGQHRPACPKVLALGLNCYSHFYPQPFCFLTCTEPWPETFPQSHALLSPPPVFLFLSHPLYPHVHTHTHTHSHMNPCCFKVCQIFNREKRKHSDLIEIMYLDPESEPDLVWGQFQFMSFAVTTQYHTEINFK